MDAAGTATHPRTAQPTPPADARSVPAHGALHTTTATGPRPGALREPGRQQTGRVAPPPRVQRLLPALGPPRPNPQPNPNPHRLVTAPEVGEGLTSKGEPKTGLRKETSFRKWEGDAGRAESRGAEKKAERGERALRGAGAPPPPAPLSAAGRWQRGPTRDRRLPRARSRSAPSSSPTLHGQHGEADTKQILQRHVSPAGRRELGPPRPHLPGERALPPPHRHLVRAPRPRAARRARCRRRGEEEKKKEEEEGAAGLRCTARRSAFVSELPPSRAPHRRFLLLLLRPPNRLLAAGAGPLLRAGGRCGAERNGAQNRSLGFLLTVLRFLLVKGI